MGDLATMRLLFLAMIALAAVAFAADEQNEAPPSMRRAQSDETIHASVQTHQAKGFLGRVVAKMKQHIKKFKKMSKPAKKGWLKKKLSIFKAGPWKKAKRIAKKKFKKLKKWMKKKRLIMKEYHAKGLKKRKWMKKKWIKKKKWVKKRFPFLFSERWAKQRKIIKKRI